LNPTSIVKADPETNEVYLECDNPECVSKHIRMESKEGDEKGIGLIKDRVINDFQVMEMAHKMYGIEKIELFNALDVETADKFSYDFERTKAFTHKIEGEKVISTNCEYIAEDHNKSYYSMFPPYVVVSFIRELAKVFGLTK
jgi:hypothetical protein